MKRHLLAVLVCCLALFSSSCGFFSNPQKEAEKSYQQFITSIVDKEWAKTWNLMSYESQKQYDKFIFQPFKTSIAPVPQEKKKMKIPGYGVTISQLENMTAQEFFIMQMNGSGFRETILNKNVPDKKVKSVEIKDNEALISFGENSIKVTMRKEDGIWRVVAFPPGDISN